MPTSSFLKPVGALPVISSVRFALILSVSLLLSVGTATASLALTHVTVIDATDGPPRTDCTVLIDGDRIASVSKTAPSGDARVIEARGKFLIRGLCDMHVHLAGVSADPKWIKETLLPLLVAHGVTTVRDWVVISRRCKAGASKSAREH